MTTPIGGRGGLKTGVIGFALVIGSLWVMGAREGQAQRRAQDVVVVNTAADAVPTAAQGTTTIAGDVNVANSPTVSLAPGGTVGISASANTVQISNGAASPIWVRDVDSARQPVQAGTLVTIPSGQLLGTGTVTTVGVGKRLVIEYASASLQLPTGQQFVSVVLQSPPGTYSHFLTPTLLGAAGGNDVLSVSQSLRLYASAGQDVLVGASRNGTAGTAIVNVSISGYLIDVP
jgi:hypothetical protein